MTRPSLSRSAIHGISFDCLKAALIGAMIILTSACITTASLQEAAGEAATINVRLLGPDSDSPMIFIEESPQHNETILAVYDAGNKCQRFNVYVNPLPGSPNILTAEPLWVKPLSLDRESDERALWSSIQEDNCAMILMIGAVEETGFAGLSLSSSDGVIKRVGMYFQDDKPGKGAFWFYSVSAAPLADAILIVVGSPFFGAMAVDSATAKPFSDPVTVSFDFPDGTRRQTSLDYTEAEDMLRRNFPHLFSPLYKEWNDIRFWTRAALVDLRLDYREVTSSKNGNVKLAQVNQYQGRWRYDPRDGRKLKENISEPLLDTRYIRYKCSSCEAVPLIGIVREPPPPPQPPEEDEAHRLLLESAEKGNPVSQWALYADEGKRMEDWRWLCMAADQKHGKAMVETGNILWEGRDGVTQDREMAYCWYRFATESGNKDADSDVMAAEWILSDAEIESALTRCAEDNLPACEEILLSVPTQHKDTGQTLPDSQE
jgi:hypothetical protein